MLLRILAASDISFLTSLHVTYLVPCELKLRWRSERRFGGGRDRGIKEERR